MTAIEQVKELNQAFLAMQQAEQNAKQVTQLRQQFWTTQQAQGVSKKLTGDNPAQVLNSYSESFAEQVAQSDAFQQVCDAAEHTLSSEALEQLKREQADFSAFRQQVQALQQAQSSLRNTEQDVQRIEAHIVKVAPLASQESSAARRRGIRNMFFGVSYVVGFVALVTFVELLLAFY